MLGLAAVIMSAASAAGSIGGGAQSAMLEQLRNEDLRVATIAFRLATKGRSLCSRSEYLSGLIIHTAGQYAPSARASVQTVFRLDGGAGIEAVVPGSPADVSGVEANDQLVKVDDQPVVIADELAKADFTATARLLDQLDAAIDRGSVRLQLRRGDASVERTLTGVAGCASRIQLVPGKAHNAGADGRTISLSTAVLRDVASDDELAFVIAHEMSHNILGHRDRLDAAGVARGLFSGMGRSASKVRQTEEEADYLALYLMTAAGYDPTDAASFCGRFEHAHGWGILADATHLNGAVRVAFVRLTAEEIASKRRAGLPVEPDFAGVASLESTARAAARGTRRS